MDIIFRIIREFFTPQKPAGGGPVKYYDVRHVILHHSFQEAIDKQAATGSWVTRGRRDGAWFDRGRQ